MISRVSLAGGWLLQMAKPPSLVASLVTSSRLAVRLHATKESTLREGGTLPRFQRGDVRNQRIWKVQKHHFINWLVVEPTPLKNMSSSVGMMKFRTSWGFTPIRFSVTTSAPKKKIAYEIEPAIYTLHDFTIPTLLSSRPFLAIPAITGLPTGVEDFNKKNNANFTDKNRELLPKVSWPSLPKLPVSKRWMRASRIQQFLRRFNQH